MSAALTAQPGLHSMATAVSTNAKVNGRNKKRKKNTMAGGACATGMAQEESEAVTDSVPVLSWKGAGKLQNHLWNSASRMQYLEASNKELLR